MAKNKKKPTKKTTLRKNQTGIFVDKNTGMYYVVRHQPDGYFVDGPLRTPQLSEWAEKILNNINGLQATVGATYDKLPQNLEPFNIEKYKENKDA